MPMTLGPPIGIFGGTFDPIHYGHLRLAIEACDAFDLERIHLVPTGDPVHRRQPHATGAERAAMLTHALNGTPRLVLDERELNRAGPSYMVDTLADFRAEFPERSLCLLLGMDAFAALDTWYRWDELLDFAHIGLVARPGAAAPQDGPIGAMLRERRHDREELRLTQAGCIVHAEIPPLDISSTRIRALLAAGRSPRYLLPDAVVAHIQREGLYTDAK